MNAQSRPARRRVQAQRPTAGVPTVREVLALEPVRTCGPRVVAGEAALDRPVRWVHVAEVPDIASLLSGGELVLTTGIGLPADDDGLCVFIRELAEVGIAGLVVELGRRYDTCVPAAMVSAAGALGLPLIEMRRPTPFVRVTEAVHALIVDAQLTELRATEEIHQRFTELSVEGAEPAEVLAQVAALAGCPVVLENLSRQVLGHDPAGERADLLLDGWESQSRRIRPTVAREYAETGVGPRSGGGRTGYDAEAGWLVTAVGARGQDWGRLLLRWPADGSSTVDGPPTRLTILLERAASTLALGRLIQRDAEGLARQMHGSLLAALLDHTRPVDEVALRARALGVPLERRRLIGVVARLRADDADVGAAQARLRDLAEVVGQALRETRLHGLASAIDDHTVGALLTLRPGEDEDAALHGFATALRRLRQLAPVPTPRRHRDRVLIVAAGSGVDSPREARRSLVEARQIADAARHDTRAVPVFRLPHVGLAGLLHLLRDEPRMQTFVERELGSLLDYDATHPREVLLGTLRGYLEHGRNKSAAATAAHMSRPAFYERLARIGRILDADLDSVEACLSLHVALLALAAIRDT